MAFDPLRDALDLVGQGLYPFAEVAQLVVYRHCSIMSLNELLHSYTGQF
jgi:hypothetical protein